MTESPSTPLKPMRAALLANARTEAQSIVAAARHEATELVAAAWSEANTQVTRARAQGEADAAALQRIERGRIQQENRGIVLARQQEVYEELVRQAQAAVRRQLDEPAARAHLEAELRRRLGNTAIIREDPGGGIVAETPRGTTIDASVEAIVENALTELDLEPLWTAAQ